MNAFSAALNALYADPNLSSMGSYTLATGGPAIEGVRLILSTPDAVSGGARTGKVEMSVQASSLAPYGRCQRRDAITLQDGRLFTVEEAEMDDLGLEFRLRCSTVKP
jgi:hypothetical protein